jgi:hypothetical protein
MPLNRCSSVTVLQRRHATAFVYYNSGMIITIILAAVVVGLAVLLAYARREARRSGTRVQDEWSAYLLN